MGFSRSGPVFTATSAGEFRRAEPIEGLYTAYRRVAEVIYQVHEAYGSNGPLLLLRLKVEAPWATPTPNPTPDTTNTTMASSFGTPPAPEALLKEGPMEP